MSHKKVYFFLCLQVDHFSSLVRVSIQPLSYNSGLFGSVFAFIHLAFGQCGGGPRPIPFRPPKVARVGTWMQQRM
jgi:hypothetical protein